MPIPQLLSHNAEVEGDLQHERIRVPQPPLPRRVRLFQNPPSPRRIIIKLMKPSQMVGGSQHPRIILTKIRPPQSNGMREHGNAGGPITLLSQILSTLPGRLERRGLRHPRHAARYNPPPPHPTATTSPFVRSHFPRRASAQTPHRAV